MLVTAQRVVRDKEQGVNAFLYWHGRDISEEDPETLLDAPAGPLQVRMVEVRPGGNLVRSYLDLIVPDQSTQAQIEAQLDVLEHLKQPDRFPLVMRFGSAAARVNMDLQLAAVWREEVAVLVEVARACILSYPDIRVTPRYARQPGELDAFERAAILEAAARRDTESVLALMRQLARARRLHEIPEAIRLYAETRGDDRVCRFLSDHVAGIFSTFYVPTFGQEEFERFVEWSLSNPDWGERLNRVAREGSGVRLGIEVKAIINGWSSRV